jgi:acrylyl-CoA reductase (NADPH)
LIGLDLILSSKQLGRINSAQTKFEIRSREIDTNLLSDHQVVIRNEFSSINYKDKLAWLSEGGFSRFDFLPLGFDGVGRVVFSGRKARSRVGSRVIFFSDDQKLNDEAGFQQYSVHESSRLFSIGLMDEELAIRFGIPGFTALSALNIALQRMRPSASILILGSNGNLGLIAKLLFSEFFTNVQELCLSRNDDPYDESLMKMPNFQLLSPRWDFILDTLGGQLLGPATRFLKPRGVLVSAGNVLGNMTSLPLAPLYSRRVEVIGLNLLTGGAKESREILRLAKTKKAKRALDNVPFEFGDFESLNSYFTEGNFPSGSRRIFKITDLF